MKRIWLLIALVGCYLKSNAQTTVPFYGFELSNYEAGDTLEYLTYYKNHFQHGSFIVPYECDGKMILTITAKDSVYFDTTKFKIKRIIERYCCCDPDGDDWYSESQNEVLIGIKDISIFGNSNNILAVELYDMGIGAPDTIIFDTVNSVKYLSVILNDPNNIHSFKYEAEENLGILFYYYNTVWNESEGSFELVYARSQNFGVYGTYQPIYLNDRHDLKSNALVVQYNNENKTVRVITNEHLEGSIVFYDVLGRAVMTSFLNNTVIPLDNVSPGVYFYSIIGNKTASGKFLIR